MNKTSYLRAIEYALIYSLSFQKSHSQNEQQPNVILILADDLGVGDLHVTGHPYAKTPHYR
ncbi:hypothetical protein [Ochrovirga pacifica]|uniref:hypothetical protein n=1 Tax=Ochrovirga pacifica TaxID=1042376 RepID=UPI000255A549|nr:hypothetical protein [Ochrovirga pacifica]